MSYRLHTIMLHGTHLHTIVYSLTNNCYYNNNAFTFHTIAECILIWKFTVSKMGLC